MRLQDRKKAELYLMALLRQQKRPECVDCGRLWDKEKNSKNRKWTASLSELGHCMKEIKSKKRFSEILDAVMKENAESLKELSKR